MGKEDDKKDEGEPVASFEAQVQQITPEQLEKLKAAAIEGHKVIHEFSDAIGGKHLNEFMIKEDYMPSAALRMMVTEMAMAGQDLMSVASQAMMLGAFLHDRGRIRMRKIETSDLN